MFSRTSPDNVGGVYDHDDEEFANFGVWVMGLVQSYEVHLWLSPLPPPTVPPGSSPLLLRSSGSTTFTLTS